MADGAFLPAWRNGLSRRTERSSRGEERLVMAEGAFLLP
jgi:hypothetical protein